MPIHQTYYPQKMEGGLSFLLCDLYPLKNLHEKMPLNVFCHSQMFGESIGVWLLNEWMKMGEPSNFQLVELGPGSGKCCYEFYSNSYPLKYTIILSQTENITNDTEWYQ